MIPRRFPVLFFFLLSAATVLSAQDSARLGGPDSGSPDAAPADSVHTDIMLGTDGEARIGRDSPGEAGAEAGDAALPQPDTVTSVDVDSQEESAALEETIGLKAVVESDSAREGAGGGEPGKRNGLRFLQGKKQLNRVVVLLLSLVVIGATVLFYRRRRESERFLTTMRLSVMDREVQRACKYMESNYNDHTLTVENMCGDLVTGRAFLETLFERELGVSVMQFLDQVRINRAKLFLKKGPDTSPEEMARRVGFLDKKAFLRTFDAVTGVSYSEYPVFRDEEREQG